MNKKDKNEIEELNDFSNQLISLLSYSMSKDNAIIVSKNLISEFGNVLSIFNLPDGCLREISGINENTIQLIKSVEGIIDLYIKEKYKPKKISRTGKYAELFINEFKYQKKEKIILALLDSKSKIIFSDVIKTDHIRNVDVYISKIINLIYLYDAEKVVVLYNNLTNLNVISNQDIILIERLRKVFELLNVVFWDCIIFYDNTYLSIAESDYSYILDSY